MPAHHNADGHDNNKGYTERPGVSRRGFLSGLSVGAAGTASALALRPVDAIAAVTAESAGTVRADRFGRMFALPPFADANDRVRAALMEMGRPGGLMDADDPLEAGPEALVVDLSLSENNRNNEFHTAGTHFFGQFMDHDMTFDLTSELGRPTRPEESRNSRTPAFDLDSVYRGGPSSNPALYDPDDRAKFRVESGGRFEDLPRRSDGTAIIGDPRNDENLMVAGLHAAFLMVHNRLVDELRDDGVREWRVFRIARRLTIWHYQWLIVHEFLPLFIGQPLVDHILRFGRRFYRPRNAFIPVEFQAGPYRFGHSMVRPSYAANLTSLGGDPFFGFIFSPDAQGQEDPDDLRGGARAPRRFIGWEIFFDFRDGNVRPNKRIDTRISTPLFRLPLITIPTGDRPTALPQRNLLRQLTWSLPSGQRIARAMGVPVLGASEFGELREFGVGFERSTPLWYYALKEAEVIRDGIMLGPAGGRIVGEVIIGLLQLDPRSYLAANPRWRPVLPRGRDGRFRMVDLLAFAGVDPASRRRWPSR